LRPCFVFLACAFVGCSLTDKKPETNLASVEVVSDFSTYELRRVGLLPFHGEGVDLERGRALQAAFATALAGRTTFEIVTLDDVDLEEVPRSETFRRGWTKPGTILTLARRFNLDGVLVGTVTEQRSYAPLRVGLEVDLIACETGLSIWSGRALLDAAEQRVRDSLEGWFQARRDALGEGETWELYLLSPSRFGEFAASQMAERMEL
jgi:hypothetical protein